MKKLIPLFAVILLLASCEAPQSVEFKNINNVKIKSFNLKGNVKLTADAHFFNPNAIGVNVTGADFDVFVDDKNVGKINQQDVKVSVPANADFTVPITASIPLTKVVEDAGGLLDRLFKKKEVNLKMDGYIWVSIAGAQAKVPFTYEDTQELKL